MNTIQYQRKAPGQVPSPGWGFLYSRSVAPLPSTNQRPSFTPDIRFYPHSLYGRLLGKKPRTTSG